MKWSVWSEVKYMKWSVWSEVYEVKSMKWSVWSEVYEVKCMKWSVWSEVKCSVGKGEEWGFMGKVYMCSKMARSEGMMLKRKCNIRGKIYCTLYTVLSYLGVVYPLYMLFCTLSWVYCCSCLVCIFVILCVFVQTYNKINGAIRRHFGKQMNKETKLRIHNITAKAALKFGSEAWVLKKREKQRLEAA